MKGKHEIARLEPPVSTLANSEKVRSRPPRMPKRARSQKAGVSSKYSGFRVRLSVPFLGF